MQKIRSYVLFICILVYFISLTACSSNKAKDNIEKTRETMLGHTAEVIETKKIEKTEPKPPTAEEIANAKAEAIRSLKVKWTQLINPSWVDEMKSNSNTCTLERRYDDLRSFSSSFNYYAGSKTFTLSFSDIGLTEDKYKAELKKSGISYLRSLLTDYNTSFPPHCEAGEGAREFTTNFEVLEGIVNTLEYSKNESTGEYLLKPEDINLSKTSLRAMFKAEFIKEAKKQNPNRNILHQALKEWNFKPSEIGLTSEQAQAIIK